MGLWGETIWVWLSLCNLGEVTTSWKIVFNNIHSLQQSTLMSAHERCWGSGECHAPLWACSPLPTPWNRSHSRWTQHQMWFLCHSSQKHCQPPFIYCLQWPSVLCSCPSLERAGFITEQGPWYKHEHPERCWCLVGACTIVDPHPCTIKGHKSKC